MQLAPTRGNSPASPGAEPRFDATAAFIVVVFAAALVLFLFKPLYGAVLLGLGLGAALAISYPMIVAAIIVAMLWVNNPLGDFFPFKQYTAWKDLLLAFILLGWLLRKISFRQPLIVDTPITRPLVVLICIYLASCLLSPSITHAVLGLKASIAYMVWVIILPDIIRTKKDVRLLISALLFGTICMAAYNLWAMQQPWGAFPPNRDGKILPGVSVVHNSPSSVVLPFGILFGMVIAPRLRLWKRILADGTAMIGMVGLVATGARAAWGLIFVTVLSMIGLSRRFSLLRLFVVAVIAGGILQSTKSIQVADRAASAFAENDVSKEARDAEFSTVTLPFVIEHPLGAGTGSMSAVGSAKVWGGGQSVDLILQRGFIHNGFLLVAIETGWLGLAAFVWLLVASGLTAWKIFRTTDDPLIRDSALVCTGIVIFFTSMSFFAPMTTMPLISLIIWVILGLIIALLQLDHQAIEASA